MYNSTYKDIKKPKRAAVNIQVVPKTSAGFVNVFCVLLSVDKYDVVILHYWAGWLIWNKISDISFFFIATIFFKQYYYPQGFCNSLELYIYSETSNNYIF